MSKQVIAIVTVHLLFFFLADRATAFCPVQLATTPANFIPLTTNNICAEPPGTLATDGCDDVCRLNECCKDWNPIPYGKVTLPDRTTIDCSTVNCGNVCRLACDRNGTDEACTVGNCDSLSAGGEAYIFSRNGSCDPGDLQNPFPDPTSPTHVGFGFKVAQGRDVAEDIYVFGSVENGAGCIFGSGGMKFTKPGSDNGFWMATGSQAEMLTTFRHPPASKFHGTISPQNVADYNQFKTTNVDKSQVCAAVQAAESLYYAGYDVLGNNCLDAVYYVLSVYGVKFVPTVTPSNYWCPSGNSAFSFFAALKADSPSPSNRWSAAEDLKILGLPVVASQNCPLKYPPSCGGATIPPPTDACGGADFTNCPPCSSLGATCFVDAITDCPISCAAVNPCVCEGACNQAGICYSWIRD